MPATFRTAAQWSRMSMSRYWLRHRVPDPVVGESLVAGAAVLSAAPDFDSRDFFRRERHHRAAANERHDILVVATEVRDDGVRRVPLAVHENDAECDLVVDGHFFPSPLIFSDLLVRSQPDKPAACHRGLAVMSRGW